MATHTNNFFDLVKELVQDPDVRTAALENNLRRKIASVLDERRQAMDLSLRDLAEAMGTSLSQVQRILHKQEGGNLTLRTLVRAADTLGLQLAINIRPTPEEEGKVIELGKTIGYKQWAETPTAKPMPNVLCGQHMAFVPYDRGAFIYAQQLSSRKAQVGSFQVELA